MFLNNDVFSKENWLEPRLHPRLKCGHCGKCSAIVTSANYGHMGVVFSPEESLAFGQSFRHRPLKDRKKNDGKSACCLIQDYFLKLSFDEISNGCEDGFCLRTMDGKVVSTSGRKSMLRVQVWEENASNEKNFKILNQRWEKRFVRISLTDQHLHADIFLQAWSNLNNQFFRGIESVFYFIIKEAWLVLNLDIVHCFLDGPNLHPYDLLKLRFESNPYQEGLVRLK